MGIVKRLCAVFALTFCVFTASVYFTLFHHPPADVILSNQPGQPNRSASKFYLDPSKPHSMAEIAEASWGKWMYDNKYVSVGDSYDTCDEKDRILIGKMILLPDPKRNGVKIRLYINTTIETTGIYGNIHLVAYYNGKELYNNKLDMCTAEEGDEVQILKCPIAKGVHYFVKELPIPQLLPKGDYTMKSVITNQDEKVVACSFLAFKL